MAKLHKLQKPGGRQGGGQGRWGVHSDQGHHEKREPGDHEETRNDSQRNREPDFPVEWAFPSRPVAGQLARPGPRVPVDACVSERDDHDWQKETRYRHEQGVDVLPVAGILHMLQWSHERCVQPRHEKQRVDEAHRERAVLERPRNGVATLDADRRQLEYGRGADEDVGRDVELVADRVASGEIEIDVDPARYRHHSDQ